MEAFIEPAKKFWLNNIGNLQVQNALTLLVPQIFPTTMQDPTSPRGRANLAQTNRTEKLNIVEAIHWNSYVEKRHLKLLESDILATTEVEKLLQGWQEFFLVHWNNHDRKRCANKSCAIIKILAEDKKSKSHVVDDSTSEIQNEALKVKNDDKAVYPSFFMPKTHIERIARLRLISGLMNRNEPKGKDGSFYGDEGENARSETEVANVSDKIRQSLLSHGGGLHNHLFDLFRPKAVVNQKRGDHDLPILMRPPGENRPERYTDDNFENRCLEIPLRPNAQFAYSIRDSNSIGGTEGITSSATPKAKGHGGAAKRPADDQELTGRERKPRKKVAKSKVGQL